jgi:hypothetical protein
MPTLLRQTNVLEKLIYLQLVTIISSANDSKFFRAYVHKEKLDPSHCSSLLIIVHAHASKKDSSTAPSKGS